VREAQAKGVKKVRGGIKIMVSTSEKFKLLQLPNHEIGLKEK